MKKSSKKTKTNLTKKPSSRIILLILLFAVIGVSAIGLSSASARYPVGSIVLQPGQNLTYGSTVSFNTNVTGKMRAGSSLYANVRCQKPDRSSGLVYLKSVPIKLGSDSATFTLKDDRWGWDGFPVTCWALVIYSEPDKGTLATTTVKFISDSQYFDVPGTY